MSTVLRLWGPVVGWMAAIFIASAQSDVGGFGRIPDWLTHGAVYFLLAVLVCRALAGGLGRPASAGAALVAVALSVGHGIGDEYHQSFVPGRDASAGDVAKDLGGAALGALLYRRWAPLVPTTSGQVR